KLWYGGLSDMGDGYRCAPPILRCPVVVDNHSSFNNLKNRQESADKPCSCSEPSWTIIHLSTTWKISGSRPISRVLSWTIIHLGRESLHGSSDLPESSAGRAKGFLFGLAPGGVYRATNCCQSRGALLPHPFTLT